VEAGARFIEVHVPYKPFGYWDTHEHGHERTVTLKQMIDRPVAQLIRDLRDRGLLDRTLVVLASEFSRDPLIEGKDEKRTKASEAAIAAVMQDERHYGMHAHFADAGSVLLWGGGMKRGFVYGETADEHPCKTVRDPVLLEDLHATIYAALGIPPTQSFTVERRPFYVTKDGKGVPIRKLFS
jgi:arylsulfatase A-like enzyme